MAAGDDPPPPATAAADGFEQLGGGRPDASSASGGPIFQPRLDGPQRPPPYNPNAYYLVAFFAGGFALAYVAIRNLARMPDLPVVRSRTWLVLAGLAVAFVVALFATPLAWWTPTRNIRYLLRGLALVAAVVVARFHRSPAAAAVVRTGDYTSAWRAIVPIIVGAVLQGALTAAVALVRGVELG